MILLDPDLDPYPAPQTKPAKTVALAGISTRSLALFLRKAQSAVRLRGQVSVLLTTDAAIRKLNRQFRGKNKATDVLSFPAVDLFLVSRSRPGASANEIAGDLAISVETARNQADACRHPIGTELKVLMLHGLLHLAGYDHETDDGGMAKRERALRAKLGLPLGLIERAASEPASQRVGKSALSHPSRKNKNAAKMGHPARRRKP
jgi:probable rRNA maturation factor